MQLTQRIEYRPDSSAISEYFRANMTDSRAMRNEANFYIRNTMTGIQKSPEERNANEIEVLHYVFTGIQKANLKAQERRDKILEEARLCEDAGKKAELFKKAGKVALFSYPTAEHWYLGYNVLNAIFLYTENPVYKRMVSQVNQNALRKTDKSWIAYFKSLADYRKHPEKYLGKPKRPGYIHDMTTAWWTNQVCHLVFKDDRAYLKFTSLKELLCIGKADLYKDKKLVKTEIKPAFNRYLILLTFDDGIVMPKVPKYPARIMGIDLGLSNFAAVANNYSKSPFIIPGGPVKSVNQWFNKKRASLLSSLTNGKDSVHSVKQSKALFVMSRKRDNKLRDMFYKYAHIIAREAASDKADVIVVGHNVSQKQEINIGHINNQNFVSIPYDKFRWILKIVAAKYCIPVVETEESYTSKASLVDGDAMPVYKEHEQVSHIFSGERIKRGLYKSKSGMILNADVNGAGNIIRKAYTDAFVNMDLSYLIATTRVMKLRDVNKAVGKEALVTYKKPKTFNAAIRHDMRDKKRTELHKAFNWSRKAYIYKSAEKSA